MKTNTLCYRNKEKMKRSTCMEMPMGQGFYKINQENIMKDIVKILSFTLFLFVFSWPVLAEDGHGAEEGEDEAGVELSAEQMTLAGIKVATLTVRPMIFQVYAPGEVLANGYTSYLVSSRVDSVVIQRHASLGAHVTVGQPLVTLFSDTVAEAQAAFRVADAEYRRVQKLGRKTVGEKRFILAQNDFEVSHGRLLAFGLSKDAINATIENKSQIGEYTLVAMVEGVVLSDDFRQGQRVEAGDPLMELACEKELWIEARLAPNAKIAVPAGTKADVKIAGETFSAEVIQEAHTIDEVTRTRVVRLLVDNEAHKLHPGQYADVYFNFTTDEQVLAVPETALMRGGDGDWLVFVAVAEEDGHHFTPHEVELGRRLGQFREITGVPSGSSIAMEGAFFVASEIAKSGFDPHNH